MHPQTTQYPNNINAYIHKPLYLHAYIRPQTTQYLHAYIHPQTTQYPNNINAYICMLIFIRRLLNILIISNWDKNILKN